MKGQIKIEFMIGFVIFSIGMLYFANYINSTAGNALAQSMLDNKKAEAVSVVTMLAETEGVPKGWNPSIAEAIGFADRKPFILSMQKINYVKNDCSLLSKFDLSGYSLTIIKGATGILQCGSNATVQRSAVVSRSVVIDGESGKMTLRLW